MRALNRHSLLLAPLEADGSLTLQQQLYQRLRQAILNGQLAAGTRLRRPASWRLNCRCRAIR